MGTSSGEDIPELEHIYSNSILVFQEEESGEVEGQRKTGYVEKNDQYLSNSKIINLA